MKKIIDAVKLEFKNLDEKVRKIMVNGFRFSLLVSLIGTLFLACYITFNTSNFVYYIGLKILFLSISFGASFIACAFAINRIKNDLT